MNCAEPAHELILLGEVEPTDCIKCNEIRYDGSGYNADFAVCHGIEMGDFGYNDPSYILFRFKKDKPQSHTPPTWCPLKAKEPELCEEPLCESIFTCEKPKGHIGKHEMVIKGVTYKWNTGEEAQMSYDNELKKRTLRGYLEFLFDKHNRGRLSTEILIDMIIARLEELKNANEN